VNARPVLVGAAVAVAIAAVVLYSSAYTVNEAEWAVVTQFGQPVRVVPEVDPKTGEHLAGPGLYFRTPLIQEVTRLEKRVLSWDGIPSSIPTRDKKYIDIDTFARWRIVRPTPFYQALGSNLDAGQRKLDDIVDSAVRDVIGSYNLIEVVRSTDRGLVYETEELAAEQRGRAEAIEKGRRRIEIEIAEKAAAKLDPSLGIELVDVRIKRVNYIANVSARIYERMQSERKRIASRYRSEAQEQSDIILGDTNMQLAEIEGEAAGRSAEIRGEADAEAIRLYGEAIRRTLDFYSLQRRLEAYRNSIDEKTTLVLSTDGDFLRFLKSIDGGAPGRKK